MFRFRFPSGGQPQVYRSFGGQNSNPYGGLFGFWYQYRRPLTYAAGGLAIFYAMNLERAPVTGRLRFMVVPRWYEMWVGESGYRQTMRQFGRNILPDSHPQAREVRSVMDRIIKVSGIEGLDWEVHVIAGDYPPNAFVLPSGKVFVFQSILPICANDDGLATVLAHETAHQVCRHTAEQLSKTPLYLIAATILWSITGSSAFDDLVLNMALRLPASRKMETEADNVGVLMMAEACFNPDEAVGLWKRMMKMEQNAGYVPELLSTHPATKNRIVDIEKLLPQARQVRQEHCAGVNFGQFW